MYDYTNPGRFSDSIPLYSEGQVDQVDLDNYSEDLAEIASGPLDVEPSREEVGIGRESKENRIDQALDRVDEFTENNYERRKWNLFLSSKTFETPNPHNQ